MRIEIERKIICSKCGKLIQSYMDDAFDSQWTNISPYSGRREVLCNDCLPEPPDFTKEDKEKKESIIGLENLFNTLLEEYYEAQKLALDDACFDYEELEENIVGYKNEFNKLLKLFKKHLT